MTQRALEYQSGPPELHFQGHSISSLDFTARRVMEAERDSSDSRTRSAGRNGWGSPHPTPTAVTASARST